MFLNKTIETEKFIEKFHFKWVKIKEKNKKKRKIYDKPQSYKENSFDNFEATLWKVEEKN